MRKVTIEYMTGKGFVVTLYIKSRRIMSTIAASQEIAEDIRADWED